MKDSILIKKTGQGYKLTRTISETVDEKDLAERILKVEHDIEAYTDTRDNLVNNKEEILKNNAEKIDKDIEAYGKALINLNNNLQALKDAKVLGQGKASSIQNGNTYEGVVE